MNQELPSNGAHALRFDLISSRLGPTRLVIGGIHGKEWRATAPILKALITEGAPRSGSMVVVPQLCSIDRKHISTLRRTFYETEEGRRLIALIGELKPQIYVELHCYRASAYTALTHPDRMKKRGVPPLVDLGSGLLIGSTSHHILPYLSVPGILLEVSCKNDEGREDALAILRVMRDSDTIQDAIEILRARYPEQVSRAMQLFNEWITRS